MTSLRTTKEWLVVGTPPARKPRSLWVRVLVGLTSTTALLGTAALVAAAAIVPPIGARRVARDAALNEISAMMLPGEHVVARAFASQRRWTDMWRESFGVLVATDRRLLYVGAPPTPLLRPREDGPLELLVESYPYYTAFTLEPRTLLWGRQRGLVLRTPGMTVDFLVDDEAWNEARRVARGVATRELEQVDQRVREAPRRAEEYVPYVVRRGETLTGLARRFRTSPDVLRQLNRLEQDELTVGQRLRVPKVAAADSLP